MTLNCPESQQFSKDSFTKMMLDVWLGQSFQTTRLTKSKSKFIFHQRWTKSINGTNRNELTGVKPPRSPWSRIKAPEWLKKTQISNSLTNVIKLKRSLMTSVVRSSSSLAIQTASRPTQGMRVRITAKSRQPWSRNNSYRLNCKKRTLIIKRRLKSCFNKCSLIRTSINETSRRLTKKSRKLPSHFRSQLRTSRRLMSITKCRSCS
jgi:hypothetical protein